MMDQWTRKAADAELHFGDTPDAFDITAHFIRQMRHNVEYLRMFHKRDRRRKDLNTRTGAHARRKGETMGTVSRATVWGSDDCPRCQEVMAALEALHFDVVKRDAALDLSGSGLPMMERIEVRAQLAAQMDKLPVIRHADGRFLDPEMLLDATGPHHASA